MDDDKIICPCMSVTQGMIKEAVKAGASSVEDVQSATGAGTVCGACLEEIQDVISMVTAE